VVSSLPQRYVDGLNAASAEDVSKLFSLDSVFLGSDGIKRVGRKEIHDFYVRAFGQKKRMVSLGRVVESGRLIAFEVIVHTSPMGAHGQANALDLVELDKDGLIAHKVVFYPPVREA
jgi:uncharacterized protein (TIGR02246 family)